MKVILKFDLDDYEGDDKDDFMHALKGRDYWLALSCMTNELRKLSKSDMSEESSEIINKLQSKFYDILSNRNISIDYL